MKICTKCKVEKPLTEFYKNGKESRCKPCYNWFVHKNAYPNTGAPRGQKSSEARKAAQARYREKHREKIRAGQRRYVKENKAKVLARTRKYQLAKRNATPKWLTAEHYKQIEAIYEQAAYLTKITGRPHEVDHIRPICGENECGLHVPWNLQILERTPNRRKYNKAG